MKERESQEMFVGRGHAKASFFALVVSVTRILLYSPFANGSFCLAETRRGGGFRWLHISFQISVATYQHQTISQSGRRPMSTTATLEHTRSHT